MTSTESATVSPGCFSGQVRRGSLCFSAGFKAALVTESAPPLGRGTGPSDRRVDREALERNFSGAPHEEPSHHRPRVRAPSSLLKTSMRMGPIRR